MTLGLRAATLERANSKRRKVLIVDDHPIVRQGLRRMIELTPDLTVCAEAQSEADARTAIRECMPDVMIVDISLGQGDGFELVRDVHAHYPSLPMLVLSMHDEIIYAERMLAAGARGYIMKHAAPEQLLVALRQVLNGGTYLAAALTTSLSAAAGARNGWRRPRPHSAPEQSRAAGLKSHRPGSVLARRSPGPGPFRQNGGDPQTDPEAKAEPCDQRPAPAVRHQLVYPACKVPCSVSPCTKSVREAAVALQHGPLRPILG